MHRTARFSSAFMPTNSCFFCDILWMFHCIIFVLDVLKFLNCGENMIGPWFYICWSFTFLVFLPSCRLPWVVGRAGSFSFDPFQEYSIRVCRTVPSVSRLCWIRICFLGLFYSEISMQSCWRCSLLRVSRLVQDEGLVWEVFVWPVVWVCVPFFGSGRFPFLF